MKRWIVTTAVSILSISPLAAQESLAARCDHPVVQEFAAEACLAAVQAGVSAQPALGIVIAGGNPTIGTAGGAGLRMGVVPRVSVGLRLNVVAVRLPDLLTDELEGSVRSFTQRYGAPAPAASGDIAIGVFRGFDAAPGIGGVGGLSLLGSVSYLPFSLIEDGFEETDLAYGIGGRLHLLDESFSVPGLSISLMRKKLQTVAFGNVCPGGIVPIAGGPEVEGTEYGGCAGPGDIGEFSFDLVDWSSRLVVSKHLLGLGATLGLGYDRYTSDLGFGFRGDELVPTTNLSPVFRVQDERLESDQWTVFGNLSYTMMVVTLGLEAGWQQGTSPVPGFGDVDSEFNPRKGTWFASIGTRLSL